MTKIIKRNAPMLGRDFSGFFSSIGKAIFPAFGALGGELKNIGGAPMPAVEKVKKIIR